MRTVCHAYRPTPPPVQVVLFICIITAAVALDKLGYDLFKFLDEATGDDWSDTAKLSDAASGFLIFVAVVTIVLEGLIIAQRFLNFGIVDKFTLIFHFVVYMCSVPFYALHICSYLMHIIAKN